MCVRSCFETSFFLNVAHVPPGRSVASFSFCLADGCPLVSCRSAQFEHTVLITRRGAEVLTGGLA